jgi:hypothetical protein
VRNLAQRSAEAAKEIKSLITASVERVEQGTVLVDQAGATMTEIVTSIKRVTDIMGEISAANTEQSAGVAQVGEAVSQMDQAPCLSSPLAGPGPGWDGPDRLDAKAEALGRWPATSHLPAMAEWERLRRRAGDLIIYGTSTPYLYGVTRPIHCVAVHPCASNRRSRRRAEIARLRATMPASRSRGLAHMPSVFLTPAYTARVAQVLTDAPPSVYCMAEFEPWSSRSMQLTDWRQTMLRSKVPLSSFSQGGYVAAQILVRALRGIDAEPSRASLNAALQTFADLELSMLGTRVDLRAAPAHNPNRATLAVRLEQGTWRIASPFWLIAPER